jgi:putative addiction module killer protein
MVQILETAEFKHWFNSLRDRQAQARIVVRIRRMQEGNPGQSRTLAGGIVELKIDFGPGYRVYLTRRGEELVLLLAGGDKSTQQADIKLAAILAKEYTQ